MSEPLRTDPGVSPAPVTEPDRAARIEQLLVDGLDQYFAGHYDQAIIIWTRVIFLERGHNRARAYIERARSAMAERQREVEELAHRGVAAYHEGDVRAARTLLTSAVEQGSAADEALVFLQRLNRVESANLTRGSQPAGRPDAGPAALGDLARRRKSAVPMLAAVAIVAALALGAAPFVSWFGDAPAPAAPAAAVSPDALPVVRTADTVIARARELHASGRLRDALRLLERVDVGDARREEADTVRAAIQRDLLALARADTAPRVAPAPTGPPR